MRIGVKKGGCAGMEYTMALPTRTARIDEVVEDKGAMLLIDPTAIMYLLGTEMDYKTDKLAIRFVFNNPNQTERLRLRRVGQAHPRGRGGAKPASM